MSRTYWPTPSDRIDLIKATPCPCSGAAQPVITNQDKVQRIKFSKSCCPYYTATAVTITGGSYSAGNYFTIGGGSPVDKPILFQVKQTGPSVFAVVSGEKYYTKPANGSVEWLLNSGPSGGTLTITWSNPITCPCPSYG
jgi:hypothetical protein